MANGDYTLPTPTSAEIAEMAANLAALDPERKGVEMRALRAFYPRLGWGHIQARLGALKASGRITSTLRGGSGPVPVEIWTLVS